MAKTKKQEEEKTTLGSVIELIGIIIGIIVILVFFPHSVIWNITVLLLMLSLLITVHEFGHFIAAKKFGVHVYEFAIGMGPKVIEFRRKNDPTKYTLRALPIGGYNQLAGEVMEDDDNLKPDQFMCNKPKLQRIIILIAGVCMNFILAIIFLFMLSCIWGSSEQASIVANVIPNTGAEEAGIVAGDRILKINGHGASNLDSLNVVNLLKNDKDSNEYLIKHKDGKKENIKVQLKTFVLSAETGEVLGELTEENTFDKIIEDNNVSKDNVVEQKLAGVQFDTKRKKGFVRSIKYAFTKFANTFTLMFRIIFYLISGNLGLDALSGPVGMYTVIDTATNVGSASYGLYNLIYLTAYISVNLGVMNILPFPAFDGGQLMFVFYEIITRKKGNTNVEAAINLIGFILIFALMILITYKDIFKLIG
ncbi:MAG: site-2 protease family protein [Bacilli bacterium]|nr:site-2 protease family protein [Bacilli bacterium]